MMTLYKDIIPTWKMVDFNDQFHKAIYEDIQDKSGQFIYGVIWNGRLVYRIIYIEDQTITELYRFVFYKDVIIRESNDYVWEIVTLGMVLQDKAVKIRNILCMAYWQELFINFKNYADISQKRAMIPVLEHVQYDYCKLTLGAFLEVYRKTLDEVRPTNDVPERILQELYRRNHEPYCTVKLDKDLVVVTGEKRCKYLSLKEQTRVYFDSNGAYYFVKNIVTGKWQHEDLCKQFVYENEIKDRLVDKNVFSGTCGERYTEYGVPGKLNYKNRIIYGNLLAQMNYLAAEQAAKMQTPLYEEILNNIYQGNIIDGSRSLPELLGVTGPQLKFFEGIEIPGRIDVFGKYMKNYELKYYYPDIKKRIYAVSYYLKCFNRSYYFWENDDRELSIDLFYAAAQTVNSIEKCDPEKRYRIEYEYCDYLRMRERFLELLKYMQDDDPIKGEMKKYGIPPINVKPSKIHDSHNKLSDIMYIIKEKKTIDKYSKDIRYRKEHEAQKIEYTNDKYSILMPKDAADIIREGRILHHCVGHGGYIESMARGTCRILFLRDNHMPDKPLITIEERNGAIVQCYGFEDSLNTDKAIKEFICEYANIQGFIIKAIIYKEKKIAI